MSQLMGVGELMDVELVDGELMDVELVDGEALRSHDQALIDKTGCVPQMMEPQRVELIAAMKPSVTPVESMPGAPGGPPLAWDWGLFLVAVGTVVTTTGVVVGWVTSILRSQFRDLERDLSGLSDRSRERFDKQEVQLGTLFELVRDLDGKYVPRGEFERELDRTRAEVALLRENKLVLVGRLEARIQELSDRTERHFLEIREELRGRSV